MKSSSKIKSIINKRPITKGIGAFVIVFKNVVTHEPKHLSGISHIVEHCLCEKMKEISSEHMADGLSFNASTSAKNVMFYMTGLDENLHLYKSKMLHSILDYTPTKEVFEREKSIVLAEYNRAFSDQGTEYYYNWQRKYFNNTAPIGTKATMTNITYEQFIDFINTYFRKPSHVFNISKDRFLEQVDCKQLKEVKSEKYGLYTDFPTEHNSDFPSNLIMEFDKIYDKRYNVKNIKEAFYLGIISQYMSMGLNSPLMLDVREKLKSVYYVYSIFYFSNREESRFEAGSNCHPADKDQVKAAILKCFNEHLNKPDESRFNYVIRAIKNSIKLAKLKEGAMGYIQSKLNKAQKDYDAEFLNTEFSFEEFKIAAKQFLTKEFTYVDSETI